jgi:hypothetical protein
MVDLGTKILTGAHFRLGNPAADAVGLKEVSDLAGPICVVAGVTDKHVVTHGMLLGWVSNDTTLAYVPQPKQPLLNSRRLTVSGTRHGFPSPRGPFHAFSTCGYTSEEYPVERAFLLACGTRTTEDRARGLRRSGPRHSKGSWSGDKQRRQEQRDEITTTRASGSRQ